MRSLLLLSFLLSIVVVYGIPSDINMMSEDQLAYQQYIQQLQQSQGFSNIRNNPFADTSSGFFTTSAYDVFDQMDVNCPSSTFGMTIPPAHVRFWKNYPLTQGLAWSDIKTESQTAKVLCIPHQIQLAISPLVEKISTERMIQVDPLTVPQVLRLADKIVQKTHQQITTTHDSDMETQGLHGGLGFGRGFGFGWGGLGWGRGLGLGWGGLGWGGLGGFGGWGYPGYGYPGYGLGFGYPGFGFGWGGSGLGFRRFGWGY